MTAAATRSTDPNPHALARGSRAAAECVEPVAANAPVRRIAGRLSTAHRARRILRQRILRQFSLIVAVGLTVLAAAQPGQAAQAVDVVFVLDNSGSMKTNDPSFLTREAVSNFADALAQNKELDGRVAVVLFDSKVVLAQPLTPIGEAAARSELNFALSALDFSGQRTHTPAGIERAIYELREKGRGNSRRAIILISDGKIDTGDSQNDLEVARWLQEDLAGESESNGIRIFGVAFTESADYQLMQSLARRTHARYYRAFEAAELASVVADVVDRVDKSATYDLTHVDEPPPLAKPSAADANVQAARTSSAQTGEGGSLSTRLLGWLPVALLGVGALAYANHRRPFLKRGTGSQQHDADSDLAPPRTASGLWRHARRSGLRHPARSGSNDDRT